MMQLEERGEECDDDNVGEAGKDFGDYLLDDLLLLRTVG